MNAPGLRHQFRWAKIRPNPIKFASLSVLERIWIRLRGKLATVGILALVGPFSSYSSAPASPPSKLRTSGYQSSEGAAPRFPKTLPDGVTQQTVEEGRIVFHGSGGCLRCHGQNGSGTFLAPALNDEKRIHLRTASYQEIVELVRSGVAQPRRSMTVMPPLGGAPLTDQQLRAVAAYAFSIDRGP
jgi:mono/diheme cytochrome c family protein